MNNLLELLSNPVNVIYVGLSILVVSLYFKINVGVFSGLIAGLLLAAKVESSVVWGVYLAINVCLFIPFSRKYLLSAVIMKFINTFQLLPVLSDTEKTAINSGTVWIDRDLFSGSPNFKKLVRQKLTTINDDEQTYMDTKVKQLCEMTTDWEIFKNKDLPENVWEFLKREVFGMIIPKNMVV